MPQRRSWSRDSAALPIRDYSAYRQLGVKDSTLKYMQLCDRTAQKYNLQYTFVTTTKSLSDFFQEKGDIAMSNLYKSRYLDIMDSIYDMRKFDMVKNSLLNYEIYKTTKEIEDLRTSQHERMQTIRMQWVIMCAVAVVRSPQYCFSSSYGSRRREYTRDISTCIKSTTTS